MRTSSVLLSLCTALLLAGAGTVGAQALPTAPGNPKVLSEIQVIAAMPRYPIRLREARAVRGIYAMSNGWTLEVKPDWRRVYAEIDRRGQVELLPVSPHKFVSADGDMAMEFNLGDNGDDMVLRYVPDAATAQVVVVTTLARR